MKTGELILSKVKHPRAASQIEALRGDPSPFSERIACVPSGIARKNVFRLGREMSCWMAWSSAAPVNTKNFP